MTTKHMSFSHWGQVEVPAATEYRMSYCYPHETYEAPKVTTYYDWCTGGTMTARGRITVPPYYVWQKLNFGPDLP